MENRNNISFVTISATGEKPVAEIHIAGLDRGDALAIASELQGSVGHIMQLLADTVGQYCSICKKEAGMPAVRLFASLVAGALAEASGGKAAVVGSADELRAIADRLEAGTEDDNGGKL